MPKDDIMAGVWNEDREEIGLADEQIKNALISANSLCRSALAIASRYGTNTNWDAFERRLRESLDIQHKVMYPVAEPADPHFSPESKRSKKNTDLHGKKKCTC